MPTTNNNCNNCESANITFLKTEAQCSFQLQLTIYNQTIKGAKAAVYQISSENEYQITVVSDEAPGLKTYNCRIIGFTMRNVPDCKGFVNYDKKTNQAKLSEVDTIKIDYSEDDCSQVTSINVDDIRDIKVTYAPGQDFERILDIKDFK